MRGSAEEFGPYVVYEQLGLGGMATVHRAEAQGIAGFSKQVALKRMLPSVAADANLVRSFIREARLASHLRHANVAQTYDLGKVGDTYFIAMELVPGRNLREILRHCAMVAGHMPLPIAMNIVNQIADALDYAHNLCDEAGQPLGIIHRDVSPANVIVSDGGIAKLIDFGIAKASGAGMQTQSGTVKGKFSYMAPECLLGNVDARSDLFALGIIAHELLSNRPLFQGKDDMDTLWRVRDMPILPPSRINPSVPPEIDAIVMTALDRDPEKRWQKATAMRQALTTETQRLGLVAHNGQVEEWIDKAFTKPRFHEDSEPSIEVSKQTVELARGTVRDEFSSAQDSRATEVKSSRSKQVAETTVTDQRSPFDVPTVMAPVLDQISADWSSPSAVQTVDDRPGVGWEHVAETREVRSPLAVERRATSPHVVQRSTGSMAQQPAVDRRPSAPYAAATPPVDRRPSAPHQAVVPSSGARTLPFMPPPPSAPSTPQLAATPLPFMPPPPSAPSTPQLAATPLVPPSGGRTIPMLMLEADAAKTDVKVSKSAVLAEADVGAVLDDLDQRSSVQPAPTLAKTRVDGARRSGGNFLLALLVLIAAGGAAAVVYFALPYFT